ncbi:MAG: NAD(P)/FAD-dependent oxidoreductase [Desulfovibrionales bacterium]
MNRTPHILIIGAGFAGLWATRTLRDKNVRVTIIDRNNFHTFLPLLYQVGAAELEPEQIAYPIRTLIRNRPQIGYIRAEVKSLDCGNRKALCNDQWIEFDYCLLAMGTITNYFGVPGAEKWSFPLKSLDDGIFLRNHILSCFEQASTCRSREEQKSLLTFVVVGGGSTGIEFAGAVQELLKGPLKKDYAGLSPKDMRVVLVESTGSVLNMMPEGLRAYALRKLRRMDVDVRLHARVERVTEEGISFADGQNLKSRTVIWTAGVSGPEILQKWDLPLGPGRRILSRPSLQVQGMEHVFVAGDLCFLAQDGVPLPQLAPVAVQQGRTAARNMLQLIQGREPIPFTYKDRGTMVTIGRNAAVARIGRKDFKGFFAWFLWLAIHIMNLIGFRNRIFVMINWAWDYFFFERAARMIIPACCSSPGVWSCFRRRFLRKAGREEENGGV